MEECQERGFESGTGATRGDSVRFQHACQRYGRGRIAGLRDGFFSFRDFSGIRAHVLKSIPAPRSNSQQLLDAALEDNDIRRFLHGIVIADLKIRPVFARSHDFASLRRKRVGFGLPGLAPA